MPSLPPHPSLENLKKQAKQLLKDQKAGQQEACMRFHIGLPRLSKYGLDEMSSLQVTLQEAQHVIACEYGFSDWTHLAAHITSSEKANDHNSKAQPYLLRITSDEAGTEVEFEGTLMVHSHEPSYQTLVRRTPFEFRAETSLLSGMFQTRSDTQAIQVELIGAIEGEIKSLLRGNGQHIILYEAPLFGPSHRSVSVF